jgi:LPS export ABC transporter protein LptC
MITRKTRNGIVALVLLTSISFWISQATENTLPEPVAGLDPKLNYVLRDFELQFFDENGQPTMNLRAPLLRNDPELELGTIEHPVMKLNQADIIWDLSADTATVTADKEHVELLGQVHVKRLESTTGYWVTVDTQEVSIEVTPQVARTDQPVSIFDGRNQVDAIGLELDLKSNTFYLKHQVKAIYAVN